MWIRERDIVLVSPWDFDNKRADIIWRYIKDHAEWLENNGYMTKPEAKPVAAVAPAPAQAPAAAPAPQPAAEPVSAPPQQEIQQ